MTCPYKEFAYIFKVLSDETRLRICRLICEEEQTGCDILEHLDISQSTLSYHMRIICESKIALGTKDGQWMRYRINTEQIENIKEYLDSFCLVDKELHIKPQDI